MVRRFSGEEAVAYMQAHGHQTTPEAYYQFRHKQKKKARERLTDIGMNFSAFHISQIDEIKAALKELWLLAETGKSEIAKVQALKTIIETQPILSLYHHESQKALEAEKRLTPRT